METNDPLSDDNVKERFAEMMNTYVGQGKYITFAELEKQTGISDKTLYSYTQSRKQMPGFGAALRILRVPPPEAEMTLRGDIKPHFPHDPVEFVRKANVELSELTLENNRAVLDDEICRKEALRIVRGARKAVPYVLGLSALLAAASFG